jgi:hypothetical protein
MAQVAEQVQDPEFQPQSCPPSLKRKMICLTLYMLSSIEGDKNQGFVSKVG